MDTNLRDFAISLARSVANRLSLEIRHYVRWDEPSRASMRSQKTVCGKYDSPKATALAEQVTCPDCREYIRAEEAQSDDPEEMFGPAPASFPTQSKPFDPLRDYVPAGRRRTR